jgi:hypothetical protein
VASDEDVDAPSSVSASGVTGEPDERSELTIAIAASSPMITTAAMTALRRRSLPMSLTHSPYAQAQPPASFVAATWGPWSI